MRPEELTSDLHAVRCSAEQMELSKRAGRESGSELLSLPPSEWRAAMRKNARYRGLGTLSFLLDAAHDKLETEPTIAREITTAVLEQVPLLRELPRIIHVPLLALAWKEHANALRVTDDLPGALEAINHALDLYKGVGSLDYHAAKAMLVKAQVLREMGRLDEALEHTRPAVAKFRDYTDSKYLVIGAMTEGWILFSAKRYREAMAIFGELAEEAERGGDRGTLARALQNTGACARELGDFKSAHDLFSRALPLFDELQLTTEIPRVRWGYALTLVAEGRVNEGVSELFKTRALYLRLGMNIEALTASMDIVRAKFLHGEDVRSVCAELIPTFVEAGMTQNAIEALAYLREQAKADALDVQKIERVRDFFVELRKKPTLLFLRPEADRG